MINFGAGLLTLVPSGANPTPVQVGILKESALDISFDTKMLRGAYAFPIDIARAGGKISGKVKAADINGALLAAILTGATTTTAAQKVGIEEAITISGTTFTVANGANFFEDLGVIDLTSGLSMTRVASGPTTGQYAVNTATGVYTVAAADNGHSVIARYAYSVTTAGTKTVTYANQLMGSSTVFTTTLYNTFRGKNFGVRLPATTYSKLGMPLKNEDYSEFDLEFDAFADSTGAVITAYTGN